MGSVVGTGAVLTLAAVNESARGTSHHLLPRRNLVAFGAKPISGWNFMSTRH
jgi:hypothetical protein